MKIVLAPDSFKGTLTAVQVCTIMERAIRDEIPDADIIAAPMADGGEGTLDAIIGSARGKLIPVDVCGPLGEEQIKAVIGAINNGTEDIAILEVARLFGLPMLSPIERDSLFTTSRGLGDAILAGLDLGYRKFVIGLGGSATNDGGMGMLSALGARFTNEAGKELQGFGKDLIEAVHADFTELDRRLNHCEIIVACDVTNPLLGENGATLVYGPQKQKEPVAIQILENAMGNYANLIENVILTRFRDVPGAGAAGGLGFALLAIGAKIQHGASVISRFRGLKGEIDKADWVWTGEGCSDGQTLFGKLPLYIAELAKLSDKPVVLLSGCLGEGWEKLIPHFTACLSTVTRPVTLEQCLANAEENLYAAARNTAKLLVFNKTIETRNGQ